MAFLTKALSVQMLTINRYGRKQKNEHFWMISGVKGFLVRMTTAVDLKIGCALRIPPKYYVNMCFFSSHEKWTNVTVFFSIQRGTVCPLEDFHYKDSQTMTLPHSLGNSHCPLSIFQRLMYSTHKFIWLTLSW